MKKSLLIFFIVVFSAQGYSQEDAVDPSASAATPVESTANESNTVEITKIPKPKSRVRKTGVTAPNESSSFMGDPDNLDPLNPNRDNLKDDSEPVLEDIRDVLNADLKKKPAPVAASTDATAAAPQEPPPPEVIAPTPAPAPEEVPAPVVETPAAPAPEPIVPAEPAPAPVATLSPDEPDLELEKKFHEIYKLYNINPTPDDIWAAASAKQTARLYEVQKGDTLWSISKVLFGDPNFWPKLWAINKQGILNPHFINPKMKILFYEGTEEFSPTLTVGENVPEEAPVDLAALEAQQTAAAEPVVESASEPDAPIEVSSSSEGNKFVTDTMEVAEEFKVERKPKVRPIPIPPSLPESYNQKYYNSDLEKKQEFRIQVDLGNPPDVKYSIVNDIVLTDSEVDSDVEISDEEVYKDSCQPGRILKEIEFKGDEKLTEYDIYERLNDVETEAGKMYAYRIVGAAQAYRESYLKIKECRHFMEAELIILPKNRMKELATQKQSDLEQPVIIGNPDVEKLKFYANLVLAYIDFGVKPFQVGQEFTSVNEVNDQSTATLRVLEKYGSYAVAAVISARGRIEIGDKLETK